jgi:hypothetical protein
LILDGDPKIGEPLTCAWQRCRESPAWKACREKHPDIDKSFPYGEQGTRCIAQYFREYILPGLPGADETEKLNAVLAKAPPWLLWFTHAELPVLFLGLKLPDLPSMSRFERPRSSAYLPREAFELRRLPDGVEDRSLSSVLQSELKRLALGAEPTPRARMRALRLKERDAMSGSGRPDGDSVAAWLRRMSQVSGPIAACATAHQGRAVLVDEQRS